MPGCRACRMRRNTRGGDRARRGTAAPSLAARVLASGTGQGSPVHGLRGAAACTAGAPGGRRPEGRDAAAARQDRRPMERSGRDIGLVQVGFLTQVTLQGRSPLEEFFAMCRKVQRQFPQAHTGAFACRHWREAHRCATALPRSIRIAQSSQILILSPFRGGHDDGGNARAQNKTGRNQG